MDEIGKRIAVAISAAALAGIAMSASAANVSAGLGTTGWSVNYDDTKVSNFSFTGSTLTIDANWSNLDPLTLAFVENANAAANSFGLRITLNENVSNTSGQSINGVNFSMNDSSGPATFPGVDTHHPGFAHFHNDTTSLGAFTVTGLPAGTAQYSFSGTNGLLASGGGGQQWNGIGVHEWEIAGLARNFQLIQSVIAVPEPESYAMLAIGLFGIGAARLRSKGR